MLNWRITGNYPGLLLITMANEYQTI
jgi:hypothetical protein